MNEKDKQELTEAITALQLAGAAHYAAMLEKIEEYWETECECSIRDGSNPKCKKHNMWCPFCGCAPSYE